MSFCHYGVIENDRHAHERDFVIEWGRWVLAGEVKLDRKQFAIPMGQLIA